MTGRVAIYYAPAPGSELDRFGASWLGRNSISGQPVTLPAISGISDTMQHDITVSARHYGFHATLKPPFVLVTDRAVFDAAVSAFADRVAPFEAPPLSVQVLDGFLALVPSLPSPELRALADDCVTAFHEFAGRPDEHEMARRRKARLSLRQDRYLRWWGYPYVFEDFRFHMTLTNRLPEPSHVQRVVTAMFEPLAARPLHVDAVCVFEQMDRSAPFLLTGRYPLKGIKAASGAFKRA